MADAAYTYDYSPALVPAADERGEGMWRWRWLLPLEGADVFPLPVGGTPLVAPPRLRAALDLPGLVLKDGTPSVSGSNRLAVQGKKSVAFEVWEQLGRALPDLAYVRVGDGTTIAAFVVGCEELVRCGVADRVPRVIGVQATGAAPLVAAYAAGRVD